MRTDCRLIVALDVDTEGEALRIAGSLGEAVEWVKVGHQLFTRHGPDIVRRLRDTGRKVFLDLKFHDIPNTVARAVRSAAATGASLTNVHASGGRSMLTAAAEAGAEEGIDVVAVTVLTSLDAEELGEVGWGDTPDDQVVRLARLTQDTGCCGVVCSAREIAPVRAACGPAFRLVVPGIRPAGTAAGDQKRVMTPGEAVRAGADYIVVGRPITKAPDPAKAAAGIRSEMAAAAG